MSEHKKLTIKDLKKIVKETVEDYMEPIADVIWDIKKDVLNQIEYEELDYEELIQSLFETIGDLVLIEVIKQLECYI